MQHFDLLIIGAGTAGLSTAAQIRNKEASWQISIGIIDPSENHYYQPLWTAVGGGIGKKETTKRPTEMFIPSQCSWIKEKVVEFIPEHSQVLTDLGNKYSYGQLVVAPGIQLDWHKIEGLKETLGKNNVSSNYSYETVDYTWDSIKATREGNAIFTQPAMPIKCAGAPQKICYLAEDYFTRQGLRDQIEVKFCAQGPNIFGVPRYRSALEKVIERKNINTHFSHDLVAVDGHAKKAIFKTADNQTVSIDFAMLHVTPPMSAPDFIKESPLADSKGWVDIDQYSLRHTKYENIFSLGDASSLPCSKTGAAIRKQVPVLVENLKAAFEKREITTRYNGYASCPLLTGYGSAILAEFDYDGPAETFPFDQTQERYSMYALKVYALPKMYWNGMLRGHV